MKKHLTFFLLLSILFLKSQSPYWRAGGNTGGGTDPVNLGNNIFGTQAGNNIPIRFHTAGIPRMHMNQTITNIINGQPAIPRDGFVGLGQPIFFMPPSFAATGPFSVLHLNGLNPGTGPQQFGYRNWMNYGIVSTHNRDFMFMGQRSNGALDVTDAVFAWADNSVQDNMVFTFLTEGGPGPGDLTGSGPNGREIVRYTSGGNVGMGPRFNNANAPQNSLHMHRENSANNFLQISNQASPIFGNPPTVALGPTPISAIDGLRLGIDAPNNGYLINEENRPIIFGTNSAERMRVMNLTNLTVPVGPLNPGGLAGDLTRISISHNPANPLTRPLAALHIGYNTGTILAPTATDGWRSWMDCGMLVTRESDNVYLGLKPETGGIFGQNRQDAVLSWGDDLANVPGGVGPDRFRIIFTTFTTATSPTVMTSQNGLEFARFTPNLLNNNTVADPRVGFGDFQSMGNLDPNNTIEINTPLGAPPLSLGAGVNAPFIPGSWPGSTGASGLRFRDLTSLSAVVPTVAYTQATINPTHVLTVDGNGDVVKIVPTASVQTNNGISTTSLGIVQLGINCPETNTAIVSQFQLINNRQVPMNNNNFVFTNATGSFAGQNNVGVGTGCVPGNRLEVDRNTGLSATSGIRLTQFASGAPTIPNPGPGVLATNSLGDIIYVPTPTAAPGGGVGNLCAAPQNPLTGDYEIPLGSFKYRFTGQSQITPAPALQENIVSIGYACSVTPLPVAKLSVLEQQTVATVGFENYAAHFKNANNPDLSAPNFITGGVFGQARGNVTGFVAFPPPINSGGVFQSSGALGNIGVFGRISGTTTPQLFANNGPYAIGGCFISDSNMVVGGGFSTMNYGVYSYAANSSATSNFGVFTESPIGANNSALFVSGDAFITGSDNFASDQILKQNIAPISNALATVNQLQPKTFNYNNGQFPQMNLATGLQFGLLAQQVQTVLPSLVNNATYPPKSLNGQNYPAQQFLTLEYSQLIPILIKAVQELSAQNQQQDSLIQVLTQNINACCENQQAKQTGINGNGKNAQQQVLNQMNIDLSDKDVIVLNQNIPNPYAEHTTITYNVPVQFKYAQMIFKTIDGRIIKTTDLEKGKGQLNVFASDLSNGLYMYTLIVDGKEFDTKKMVKQN